MLLTGEAGYGKSSLVKAFLTLLSTSGAGYKVACTSCSAQSGRDEPLWPFSDVMSQLLESRTKEIGEAALDVLLELAPSWASVIPIAGDVIGASIRTAQVVRERTRVNAMPNPDKLMREYVGALSKVATKQAVLIFIDDLHWSDSASTRLLSHLARHAGNMRVLVLVAYRSSDVAVEGHPLCKLIDEILRYDADAEIPLLPLSLDGVRAMARRLYANNKFPDSLYTVLYERSGGAPLFVAESLRLMQSRGELAKDSRDSRWMVDHELGDDELPRSVEAVIHNRVERLPPVLREALSLAAVQGKRFETAVLAHVMDKGELDIMKLLEPAEKLHDLIDYAGDLELDHDMTARYQFTSSVVQRELLESLRGKRRLIAYRKTAEGIEALWDGNAADYAPQLAKLYETGKVWDKACDYALINAEQARAAGAVVEAIALYEKAERLLNRTLAIDLAKQFEIDEGLSYLYELESSYDRAEERARRALRIGRDKLGWRRYAMLQMRLATLADAAGQFKAALDILEMAYGQLDKSSPDAASPEVFLLRSQIVHMLVRVGRTADAIRFAEETLADLSKLPQTQELQSARLRVMNHQATALAAGGDYQRALSIFEQDYNTARRLDLMDVLPMVLQSRASLYLTLGCYDKVKDGVNAMLELAHQISSESLAASAHIVAARSLVYQARPYAALRHLEEAEQIAAPLKYFNGLVEMLALKALAFIRLGRPSEAQAPLNRAMTHVQTSGSLEWRAYADMFQAELHLSLQEAATALPLAQSAVDLFRGEGARFESAVALRCLGHARRDLGQLDSAVEAYRQARDILADIGNQDQASRTVKEAGVPL